MKVLGDPGQGLLPAGIGGSGTATEAQVAAMEAMLRDGPRAGRRRRRARQRLHARARRWPRSSGCSAWPPKAAPRRTSTCAAASPGCSETIAAAKRAGAALHIVHVNSSAGDEIDQFLAAIQAARDAGQDVTTEAYPYGAGMTEIQSALFDDWRTWPDERFGLHQLVVERRAPHPRPASPRPARPAAR